MMNNDDTQNVYPPIDPAAKTRSVQPTNAEVMAAMLDFTNMMELVLNTSEHTTKGQVREALANFKKTHYPT